MGLVLGRHWTNGYFITWNKDEGKGIRTVVSVDIVVIYFTCRNTLAILTQAILTQYSPNAGTPLTQHMVTQHYAAQHNNTAVQESNNLYLTTTTTAMTTTPQDKKKGKHNTLHHTSSHYNGLISVSPSNVARTCIQKGDHQTGLASLDRAMLAQKGGCMATQELHCARTASPRALLIVVLSLRCITECTGFMTYKIMQLRRLYKGIG